MLADMRAHKRSLSHHLGNDQVDSARLRLDRVVRVALCRSGLLVAGVIPSWRTGPEP
jgi:hypothetical protein